MVVSLMLVASLLVMTQQAMHSQAETQPKQKVVAHYPVISEGCMVDGCNGEVCRNVNPGEEPGEPQGECTANESLACFKKHGVCKNLYDNECGWDTNPELIQCTQDVMIKNTDYTKPENGMLPDGTQIPTEPINEENPQ